MERFTFKEGVRISIEGKRYRLLNEISIDGALYWQMIPEGVSSLPRSTFGAIVGKAPLTEMLEQYAQGKLVFDDERDCDSPEERERRKRRRATLLSHKDKTTKTRIEFRRDVVREVDKRLFSGMKVVPLIVNGSAVGMSRLAATLRMLGVELGTKYFGEERKVSQATYYRWKSQLDQANDQRDLQGRFDERGNRKQLTKIVRSLVSSVIREKIDSAKARAKGDKPTVTMSAIMDESLRRLDKAREANPDLAPSLKLPSKTTFYNLLNASTTAYERSEALHGRSRTKNDFRRPYGHTEPEACLSEVQFDETLLNIY
jgi:putative transposase